MIWKNYNNIKSVNKPIYQYEITIKEKNPFLTISEEEAIENINQATKTLKNWKKQKNHFN